MAGGPTTDHIRMEAMAPRVTTAAGGGADSTRRIRTTAAVQVTDPGAAMPADRDPVPDPEGGGAGSGGPATRTRGCPRLRDLSSPFDNFNSGSLIYPRLCADFFVVFLLLKIRN